MDLDLKIDPEHFDYLKIQKGRLDSLIPDPAAWRAAYRADLVATFENMAKYLPERCDRFLDVGSGLGGIDILVRRHYGRQVPEVHLLDGIDDEPRMVLHRSPFNSMRLARNFQVKNGCPPLRLVTHGTDTTSFSAPFDLVMSFGAWCFHLPPDLYLPALVAGGLHARTVLILEVRAGRPDYLRQLSKRLHIMGAIEVRPKWERLVCRVKPSELFPAPAP